MPRSIKFFVHFLSVLLIAFAFATVSATVESHTAKADEEADLHLSQEIALPPVTLGSEERHRFIFVRSDAGLQRFIDCQWVVAGSFSFVNGPNCPNTGLEDNPDAFTVGTLTTATQACYFGSKCRLYIPSDLTETTFSLYEIGQSSESCLANLGSLEDLDNCLLNKGCILDGAGGFACPPSYQLIGPVTAIKQANPALSPTPTPKETFSDEVASKPVAVARSVNTDFSAPSVFSMLPSWENAVLNAQKVALAGGVAVVLGILILLPTQLINSTLEANSHHLRRIGENLRLRVFRRADLDKGFENQPRELAKSGITRFFSLVRALPVFVVASAITSFAEPSFGLNGLTLRFFLTALFTFLILNYGSVVLVWALFRRNVDSVLPSVQVRYFYLLILLLTVLVSRVFNFEPVVVFGAVLAFETGRVITHRVGENPELKVSAKMQFTSILVLIAIGVSSWLGYSALEFSGSANTNAKSLLGEFFAALTIEGLATLPLVLLPLRFMPGSLIYRWNTPIWFLLFFISTGLFILMLLPLEQSWETVTSTLLTWLLNFLIYSLIAFLIWISFIVYNKKVDRNLVREPN